MIDSKYAYLVQHLGLVPGSTWTTEDQSCVLVIVEDGDDSFDEPRAWCRVLKIPAGGQDAIHSTEFYPRLIGLVVSKILVRVG